jgi:hypothetical protein
MLMLREFRLDVVNVRVARTSTSELPRHIILIYSSLFEIYSSIHINGYLSTVSCCPSGTAIVDESYDVSSNIHSLLPGLVNY